VIQEYEALRCQATGNGALTRTPRGLALLLRSGVAAWLTAWRRLVSPPTKVEPVAYAPGTPLATGVSRELATVLTEMALCAHRRAAS
jgi:hypothetical protein